MGGAAKGVSVPPIDTLTNKTPSVAYFNRSLTSFENTESLSIRAAKVIAAGSVMREPTRGTKESVKK